MDNEQKMLYLKAEKDLLKIKAAFVRVTAVILIVALLVAYFMDFHTEIVSIGCIIIGLAIFIAIGIPTQKKLREISKKIHKAGNED